MPTRRTFLGGILAAIAARKLPVKAALPDAADLVIPPPAPVRLVPSNVWAFTCSAEAAYPWFASVADAPGELRVSCAPDLSGADWQPSLFICANCGKHGPLGRCDGCRADVPFTLE